MRRDVPDLIVADLFGHAKRKIIVLTAFETGPKSADLSQDRCPICREMRDDVYRIKKIPAPVRFKFRCVAAAVFVDQIFVAVDHRGVRKFVQLIGNAKSVFAQLVVVVEKYGKFACRHFQCGI